MSAIFGIYQRDGQPVAYEAMQQMSNCLAHRGRDGSDVCLDDNVGLGHRMLRTTPESICEKLPHRDTSAGLMITADARIDNREDLARSLDIKRPLSEVCDSELVLLAYLKWGEACPEKLVGDFAFVIWNASSKQLFCARDHIGVKSFYYHLSPKRFAFATEIKALLSVPEIRCELNETKIAEFLIQSVDDQTSTFYEDVLRLPAAHSLTITQLDTRINRYWSLDPNRKLKLRSDDEYAEAFRGIFTEAVRCRIRSAFPIGSSLSGGLDSSSVACTARNLLSENGLRLHTFSAVFPGLAKKDLLKIDERKYVEAVIAQGGFEPYFLRADHLSPMTDFDKVLWHGDEVYWGPNLYIHWGLYRAAQQRGVRIFLDGLDGDTTVSHGLAFLTELAWSGRWIRLINEARALSKIRDSFTARRIVWQLGFRPLIPETAFRLWRNIRGRSDSNGRSQILNTDFARRTDIAPRLQELSNKKSETAYTARRSHFNALNFPLHPYVLELADKAGAAFSLDLRYPFYDRRLMEFCLAMPGEQKLSHGWTRAVLRRAMTNVLPQEIRFRRDKANLSPNFRIGLFERDREVINNVYKSQRLKKYVNTEVFKDTFERSISRTSPNENDSLTVYGVTALSMWLQKAKLSADGAG